MHTLYTARALLLSPTATRQQHLLAWAALKSARGQTVRQSVLNRMWAIG